jgi:ADP-ribose pyrophosphatase YjhB (NUDIX family)
VQQFTDQLTRSLEVWKLEEYRGVWLRLPSTNSHLIPTAINSGFWFHHCGPEYLLLCAWLQGGREKSRLPSPPSHYVGVGGFVLNSRNELLVVQEKFGPAAGKGLWKMPGGLCDHGEDICKAVVREVKEETGIDCSFVSLSCMVQGHRGSGVLRERASDLYCVSVLSCVDETQEIKAQFDEIALCKWIPVSDVLNQALFKPDTAFGVAMRSTLALTTKSTSSPTQGLLSNQYPVGFGRGNATVLHT